MLVTSCDLYWEFLAFRVTPKVFTPCLEVLHEMWGAWYMVDPWCFAMYLHIGNILQKIGQKKCRFVSVERHTLQYKETVIYKEQQQVASCTLQHYWNDIHISVVFCDVLAHWKHTSENRAKEM